MSAYSIASKPAKSHPLAMASESPSTERQKVCSNHCRLAIGLPPNCTCASIHISSASDSYDCTSLRFMPGLQSSDVLVVVPKTLALAASGSFSPATPVKSAGESSTAVSHLFTNNPEGIQS